MHHDSRQATKSSINEMTKWVEDTLPELVAKYTIVTTEFSYWYKQMLTCQWYLFNPARFTGSTTLSCSRRWHIYQTCVHSEPMCVLIEEEWFYKLILLSHPHRSCHSVAEIVTVTLKTAKSSSNVGQSNFYFVIRFLSVFADVQGVASVTSISSLGHPPKIDYNCETSSYWCDDERYSQENERQYLDKALPVQRAPAEVCLEELHFTGLRLTFDLSFHCYILLGWWHASCDRRCRDHLDKTLILPINSLVIISLSSLCVLLPPLKSNEPFPCRHKNPDDDNTDFPYAVIEVKKALLNPIGMLFHLSDHFNKPHQSRKIRVGIFEFYEWDCCAPLEFHHAIWNSIRSLVGWHLDGGFDWS